ncbi:MAG: fasciclin domain-containing protein [Rikenellaceae bacterium]|nr:fasciclin domain-containing protein [Rikenellaceae bacterium]
MKKLLYIFLTGLFLFSCKEPYKDEIFAVPDGLPIATSIKEGIVSEDGVVLLDPEEFTLWVEILEYTDLYKSLNLDGTFTCFVPNNEGVQEFLRNLGYSSVTDMDLDYAINLVKYHTISTYSYVNSEFLDGVIPEETESGDYLSISFGDDGINSIYINDYAVILALDLTATNGVIHTLDKVLIPIEGSIAENIGSDPDFQIFADMIERTGYAEYLSLVSEVDANGNTIKYRRTLFAVPDSIFLARNIGDVYDLAQYLGEVYTTDDSLRSQYNLVNQFVAYHILSQMQSYSDLATFPVVDDDGSEDDGSRIKSKVINTEFAYGLISVFEVNKILYLNYSTETNTGVEILVKNWNTKNGMIHVVNDILEVEEPELVTVVFEFTDYSEIASFVGDNYRNINSTSTIWYPFSSVDDIDGVVVWENPTATNTSRTAAYALFGTNTTYGDDALYKDYLILDLGIGSTVTMTTYAIRRGKYSVRLGFYNHTNTEPTGYLRFTFDGVLLPNAVATRGQVDEDSNALANGYMYYDLGEIEFTETRTHELIILSASPALGASGGSYGNYMSWLDYLIFEPIEE